MDVGPGNGTDIMKDTDVGLKDGTKHIEKLVVGIDPLQVDSSLWDRR
jgi:hypothetical protein